MISAAWIEAQLRAAGQLRMTAPAGGGLAVRGATQDSRNVAPGQLFVALPGENSDGHRFADEALRRGAAAALLGDETCFESILPDATGDLYLVEDPLTALQALASAHLRSLAPRVVAITGSSGKTGCKEYCAALLRTLGPCFMSAGNYNNQIGLPLTLLDLAPDQKCAVLEMGCSSGGEIRRLCELFPPEIGIVTNIGHAHLEELGGLAGVARAKGELPAALAPEGLCILPGEDEHSAYLAGLSAAPVRRFGFSPRCDLRIEDRGSDGLAARAACIAEREIRLPHPYRHSLLSLGAAWLAARHLGAGDDALAAAVGGLTQFTDRGGLFRIAGFTVMDDSYNANPDSMKAALDWLGEADCAGSRWALIGDMLELGEAGASLHAECGAYAAKAGRPRILAMGPLSAHLVEGARRAGLRDARHCSGHEEMARLLAAEGGAEDLLLLKGSRGMEMERVLAALENEIGAEREVFV